jgi:hypothetical protein
MDRIPCPSCGGAGGGPFGRAGSAWDDDGYVCPRCAGTGMIDAEGAQPRSYPGIAKTQQPAAAPAKKGRVAGS